MHYVNKIHDYLTPVANRLAYAFFLSWENAMKALISAVFLSFFVIVPAWANIELTPQMAGNFVRSMHDVQHLARQMDAEGKNKVLDARIKKADAQSFRPYSHATAAMREKFSSDYKTLNTIAKNHGFSNAEEWASTGDAVIVAYLASELEGSAKSHIQAAERYMNAETFKQLPADAKKQLQQSVALMRRLNTVPADHIIAVRPHRAAIEKFIEEQAY